MRECVTLQIYHKKQAISLLILCQKTPKGLQVQQSKIIQILLFLSG